MNLPEIELGHLPDSLFRQMEPKRLAMLPEFMDGGESRTKIRQHYPPSSYRDGINPPEICPRCGTKTHVEGENVYCRDRLHSWAIPIPDEKKFEWNKVVLNAKGPQPQLRTIKCAYCGETVTGMFTHYQKYCSVKCYTDRRRIMNREAYRKKGMNRGMRGA